LSKTYVLNFHGVGAPRRTLARGEDGYWLSESVFRASLDAVAATAHIELTFDDGNASDVEVALPELRDRGLSATFFVTVDRIGTAHYLTWSQLAELNRGGMRVGCHGMSHCSWPGCSDEELTVELVDARTELEQRLGERVDVVACPFGAYDRRVLLRARSAGYAALYTTDGGATGESAWLRRRTTVTNAIAGPGLCAAVRSPLRRLAGPVKTLARAVR
jgi:peptidoglycan/xylan/chitin deacetylase (PgdA/CDA1 family)